MANPFVPKVFVVDDDETICRALERLLRSAGHSVETYTSAEQLLARSPLPEGSALVLDVRMPEISGPRLMQELAERHSSLRIFFITADDDVSIRKSVLAAGACGWFTKPVDGESLLAAIGAPARKHEAR
jgi:FixJ family two-component response regulator